MAFHEGQRERVSDGVNEVLLLEGPDPREDRRIVPFIQLSNGTASAETVRISVKRGAVKRHVFSDVVPAQPGPGIDGVKQFGGQPRSTEQIVLEGGENMSLVMELVAPVTNDDAIEALVVYGHSRSNT